MPDEKDQDGTEPAADETDSPPLEDFELIPASRGGEPADTETKTR